MLNSVRRGAEEILLDRHHRLGRDLALGGRRERPQDRPAIDLVEFLDLVFGVEQHAEIAAGAAADRPEQVAVDRRAGGDGAAVGQHHAEARHVVAMHAEGARGEPVASALHEAAHADVVALARRQMHAACIERGVHLAEGGAAAHGGGQLPGIDRDVVEFLQIDDERAGTAGIARRGVAPRSQGDGNFELAAELQRDPPRPSRPRTG